MVPPLRRFRRLVQVEAGLALLVLAAAGVLTDLQRAADAPLLADAPGRLLAGALEGSLGSRMATDDQGQLLIVAAAPVFNTTRRQGPMPPCRSRYR